MSVKLEYKLIKCIDRNMDQNHLMELSAPGAAEVLEKAGLHQDSDTKGGKPLREIFRAGGYGEWAYQIGDTWHIKRSSIKWPASK